MRGTFLKIACGATIALAAIGGRADAGIIVTNFGQAQAAAGSVYVTGPPQSLAQEFTVGSTSMTLASVQAILGNNTGGVIANAVLLADNGNTPGSTVVATFSSISNVPTSGYATETFTTSQSVTLAANTNYWFVLSATGGLGSTSDRFLWGYTNTTQANLPHYAFSHDNGSSWTVESGGPYLIQVNSPNVVPEPGSLALVALGLPALALARRIAPKRA